MIVVCTATMAMWVKVTNMFVLQNVPIDHFSAMKFSFQTFVCNMIQLWWCLHIIGLSTKGTRELGFGWMSSTTIICSGDKGMWNGLCM